MTGDSHDQRVPQRDPRDMLDSDCLLVEFLRDVKPLRVA